MRYFLPPEAGSRPKSKETELYKAGVQWGAKVYHLISVLRSMSDIKPGLVEGTENCHFLIFQGKVLRWR